MDANLKKALARFTIITEVSSVRIGVQVMDTTGLARKYQTMVEVGIKPKT